MNCPKSFFQSRLFFCRAIAVRITGRSSIGFVIFFHAFSAAPFPFRLGYARQNSSNPLGGMGVLLSAEAEADCKLLSFFWLMVWVMPDESDGLGLGFDE